MGVFSYLLYLIGLKQLAVEGGKYNNESFLSVIGNGNATVCVTNGTEALYFNYPLNDMPADTKFTESIIHPRSTVYCESETDNCPTYWSYINWRTINSLKHSSSQPIFDERWEKFPTFKLSKLESDDSETLVYTKILNITTNGDGFSIPLSIRAANEIHLFLCSKNTIESDCYWFLLMAWKQKASTVRKCEAGSVPKVIGKYTCQDVIGRVKHQPFMSTDIWNHFILKKVGKTLSFWHISNDQNQKLIIEYMENSNMFEINHLLGHSKNQTALLKLHSYQYLMSDSPGKTRIEKLIAVSNNMICISFYMATCSTCILRIQLIDHPRGTEIYKTDMHSTHGLWMRKRILIENVDSTAALIVLESILENKPGHFWAIDKVRQCGVTEIRILPFKNVNNNYDPICRTTRGSELKMEKQTSTFPGDIDHCRNIASVGSGCIPSEYLTTDYLGNSAGLKFCEVINGTTGCFCSPGRTGSDCKTECVSGNYGYGCKNKCHYCEDNCDIQTGHCQCDRGFEPPKCDIPKRGAVLKNGLEIIKSEPNSCKVEIKNAEYDGKIKPTIYQLQYMELSNETDRAPGRKWIDSGGYISLSDESPVSVGGLSSSTTYAIRALISSDIKTIKDLESSKLPYQICNTSCKEWTADVLNLVPESNSVTFNYTIDKAHCKPESYKYCLLKTEGGDEKEGTIQRTVVLNNLTSYTSYLLILKKRYKSNNYNITKQFLTLEGEPEAITKLKKVIASTSIHLEWKKPNRTNGIIRNYTIIYEHLGYISCIKLKKKKENRKIKLTKEEWIEIDDLVPYSLYQMYIYATNNRFYGQSSNFTFRTSQVENIGDNETSSIVVNYGEGNKSIYVELENIKCEVATGPVTINISIICQSDWCLNKQEAIHVNIFPIEYLVPTFGPLVIYNNTQPFTNYSIVYKYCRQKSCKPEKKTSIRMSPSVPNEIKDLQVTSTGTSANRYGYISLRWLPPNPPTGELEEYRILIEDSYNEEYDFHVEPKSCKIWPEFNCANLKKIIRNNDKYLITVYARNTVPSLYVEVGQTYTYIKERKSQEPIDVRRSWKDDNLTLTWKYPNQTNGDLVQFTLKLLDKSYVINLTNEEDFKLNNSFQIPDHIPLATKIKIEITADNRKFVGKPAHATTHSPPPTPRFIEPPIFSKHTITSIRVLLNLTREMEHIRVDKSYLFVLVTDPHLSSAERNKTISLYQKLHFIEDPSSRIVFEKDLLENHANVLHEIIIGEDLNKMGNYSNFLNISLSANTPLKLGYSYNTTLLLCNQYKRKIRADFYSNSLPKFEDTTPAMDNRLIYMLFLLFFIIPLVGYITFRKKFKFGASQSLEKICDQNSKASPNVEFVPLDQKLIRINRKPVMKVTSNLAISMTTNPPLPSEIFSKPIEIGHFETYVKQAVETGELEKQHALFPRGQVQPCDYGTLKINKLKNRYNNLVPYDHSRVNLQKLDGDEYSDYINANYIHGYKIERAYIATQGPKQTTVTDFWRMIWQENVKHIIMLANIYESGKKKVEQYWPTINQILTFGDITVKYHSGEVYANFEARIFYVTSNNEERKIEQLHFTTWPDHGVPLYSQSLVAFMRRLLKMPLSSASPIVIHCSAGVGRTGTIILIDICLRIAAKEGTLDILNNLQKLREQRSNMVDNVEQYKLVHLSLLECLMGLQTSIPCNEDMSNAVSKLIEKNDHKIQMDYLLETSWQDEAMKTVADEEDLLPIYPEKNRNPNIYPEIQSRVFLTRYPVDDATSSYLNLVQVDGFRCPGRYYVTEHPMKNTLGDFWRLVVERNVTVIISLNEINLNDQISCRIWPSENVPEIVPVDFLLIKYGNTLSFDSYDILTIHIWMRNKNPDSKIKVEVILFKKWPADNVLPENSNTLLSFIKEIEEITRRSEKVLVTCYDGVTACGVYVALSFVIEKMKLEQECDVCQAVRTVRHSRKQFVTNEKQFIFLYEAAVEFISYFETYANFQS